MNPVLTRPEPPSSVLALVGRRLIMVALAAGVILALRLVGLGESATYRTLTVENPSQYIVNIEVTSASRDGWFDVGSVKRENRQTFEELVDPGEQWMFRFSYGGIHGGELMVSRDRLAHDGWAITVPAEVTERLREAGLSESVY